MEREEYLDQYFHRSSEAKKKANERLQLAKEMDAAKDLVAVRIDKQTIRLMPREKAELFIKKQKENEK
jgi:flagellar motor protein MotB